MKKIFALIILITLAAAAAGCITDGGKYKFEVKGMVDKPGTFSLEDYRSKYVTINAKLDGDVTHLPAQDYTGVPLRVVLSDAGIKAGATQVKVSASDGYSQAFELSNVTGSDDMLLIEENDTVRLVAKGYAGGAWVRFVTAVEVS